MLDLILLGKRAAGEAWSSGLEAQLCYELKTFLLAGHETSASMLTLTLLEALHDPAVAARILEEAAAVLGPPEAPRVRPSLRFCHAQATRFLIQGGEISVPATKSAVVALTLWSRGCATVQLRS